MSQHLRSLWWWGWSFLTGWCLLMSGMFILAHTETHWDCCVFCLIVFCSFLHASVCLCVAVWVGGISLRIVSQFNTSWRICVRDSWHCYPLTLSLSSSRIPQSSASRLSSPLHHICIFSLTPSVDFTQLSSCTWRPLFLHHTAQRSVRNTQRHIAQRLLHTRGAVLRFHFQ